ncbi:hypothetical protein ACJMK2_040132 [Sinanodonta woodiana]|uniref:Protein unc-80 homolog n=1 Tax=Sinanodonta woodiana TaxID=1069815 RepID=A0ABD3WE28_SINWO
MPKRKTLGGDDMDGDQSVPLPIQTFFWRQTSPFIRPKLGKLCDASCVSFERVVVQNILHGQPPSLCEAIQSVSRWKVIQVAFPHVMHACAAMLSNRKQYNPDSPFGKSETKLLYTLHWIILDAASECEDLDTVPEGSKSKPSVQLHALDTIQLFIYLFAPLVESFQATDFQNLKLENGLRIWQPMWDYQQPDIPCFSTPVKPQRNVLRAQRNLMKVNTNAANIYIGKGSSRENLLFQGPFEDPSRRCSVYDQIDEGDGVEHAPIVRMSDICAFSTSSHHSGTIDIMCENCNNILSVKSSEAPNFCRCGRKDSFLMIPPESKFAILQKLGSSIDKEYVQQRLVSAITSGVHGPTEPDVLCATFFDVAVLRCLFCLHWSEDGIHWTLKYIHQRLLEICDEFIRLDYVERGRSKSLPFQDIQLLRSNSIPSSAVLRNMDKNAFVGGTSSAKHASVSPQLSTIPSDSEMQSNPSSPRTKSFVPELRKEPPFKKVCMVELRQYPYSTRAFLKKKEHYITPPERESKLFKSQSDNLFSSKNAQEGLGTPVNWNFDHGHEKYLDSPTHGTHNLIAEREKFSKGSLTWADEAEEHTSLYPYSLAHSDRESIDTVSQQSSRESSNSSQFGESSSSVGFGSRRDDVNKPIITITQESPRSSLWASSVYNFPSKSDGSDMDESVVSQGSSVIPRSLTDSNINYYHEEEANEVAGAVHYIQKNGHLNYKVILQAVHFIAVNERNFNFCEVLLNILNCLMDIGIIEKKSGTAEELGGDKKVAGAKEVEEETDGGKEVNAFSLAMDSLISIYKILGCPHGCGDGVRGNHGDLLRMKGHECLQRLQRMNPPMFRSYVKDSIKSRTIQETVDFLHALIGFCSEPSSTQSYSHGASYKKSVSQEGLATHGFSNNFGHSIGGEGYRGVEGVLVANSLKTFVSKCLENVKDLYSNDNISLFCDIRLLITYLKEFHGGTFRRVALSGLLDSYVDIQKKKEQEKENKARASFPISRTTSVTSESGDEKEQVKLPFSNVIYSDPREYGKSRRSLFRKKLKKSLTAGQYNAASDSEILDEMFGKHSPRASLSANEDESPSNTATPKRKFSKFHIGWKKFPKSDHEEDSPSETTASLDRRESRSDTQFHSSRPKGKMSFKTASHATLTFLSARKRIEGGLKHLGKRMSKRDSIDDTKLHQSEFGDAADAAHNLEPEKRLVDKFIVKSGMFRFSFLLECCQPGSMPDPQLLAAMLQLEAPVIARASLLLECAHFVHRCNQGDWPSWMRLNLPSFRSSVAALQSRGQPSGYRRMLALQKIAGRMFYAWAENLGYQLEFILAKEHTEIVNIVSDVHDEQRRKQLRAEDDIEDFLDEAAVNQEGSECPYALKMLGCLVLEEVTIFLRENFQYLPRTKKSRQEPGWDKNLTSRRWSSMIGSPGHSDKSSESNLVELPQSSSAQGMGSPGERKISFAVQPVEKSDSPNSSTTSISLADPPLGPPHTPVEERKGRRLAQGRQKLLKHLRRGSSHNTSLRHNRSFRLRRQQEGGSFKLYGTGSIRSRKVSSQSLMSQEKFPEPDPSMEDIESVAVCSEEQQEAAEEQQDIEDEKKYQNMPWLKVVIQLANMSNFICTHQNYCHPNCYERQRRSCSRLVIALKKVYQSTEEGEKNESEKKLDVRRDQFKERLKRRSSPAKRRESTPLLEKIKTDVSVVKLKMNNTWKKEEKTKQVKEDIPIIKYLTSQAQKLTQCPMGILAKAAPILSEDNFVDIMPVAWELMLESDQELAAAAASVFLLSSARAQEKAQNTFFKQLQHEDTGQRINAVLRYGALWRFRHQVWPRMEEGANLLFRIPPPGIDFTLPSPTIGLPSQSVVDPPWTPHFKTKIEEVTVNQEKTKSLVTATTTRRKQQQEMIRKALHAEEERKRVGREMFPMTTISVTQLAAYEPSLHHASEDHEEGEEERTEQHPHHIQLAQTFFPSCICAVVLPIIHLLDDGDVNLDGIAVSEVAGKVIWNCMIEEPVLFLRYFLEKLTHKDKQEELLFLLRKMLIYYRELPSQMAHSLFNYLIGFVMFYVRTPQSAGNEAIGGALALLWQVIPSVEGIYFKDLKQTLKKEQCDPHILISANVPMAKKIVVHGPDLTGVPSQFPVHEDTQFITILQESLEFFNIPEEEQGSYYLVDTKSNQIHNLNSYVRDFYFFRRNFYPQLSLVHMNPEEALDSLHKQVLVLKFVEIGKVLFSTAVLESTAQHQMQNHVAFLHEELLKLPSFPRKALEAEFSLYHGNLGKEIYGLDTLHKYSWVKLMYTMFMSMTSSFNWSSDLPLFLNVVNGCILLNCEDTALLRYCLGIFINFSRRFKHIFSMNGFLYIMPTILKVYSNNQPNPVLCTALEFVCKQFFLLHRKPFILQMFGSVAPILDMAFAATGLIDCSKVQPDSLFKLLLALEKDCPDNLSVLDVVEGEKPLKALDFCYENDPDTFNILEVMNMCVTVIAYSPDSFRSIQMLTILEVVLPRHLEYLKRVTTKKDNPTAARVEINAINNISVSIRALISSSEFYTRSMSLPQRQLETERSNNRSQSRGSPVETSFYYDDREDSHASRHMEEGRRKQYTQDDEDVELRNEFRKPRDMLLNTVAEFFSTCQPRLKNLRKTLADPTFKPPELLDHKAHSRLAEIANTLMKLAPYDSETMACAGLQRYMTDILPITDWSQEQVRPALNLILRRLDRLFSKISKKSTLRRKTDWDAAGNLLKGVFLTLKKFPYIAHLPHLKTLINVLISIVLSSGSGATGADGLPNIHRGEVVPPAFSSALVKLVAMQMESLGNAKYYAWVQLDLKHPQVIEQFSLEHICGGMSVFPSSEMCINMLVNFILPLCIRVGCGRRDTPKLRQTDINLALTVILNALTPPVRVHTQQNSTKSAMHHLSISEYGRCSSFIHSDKNHIKYAGNELLIHTAYLGLEILMICFDKALASEWHRVAKCIHDLGRKGKVSLPMWKFLDFVVTHRLSLFLLLQPFIQFKMMKVNCDTAQEYYIQQTIKDKLQGYSFAHPKCTGGVLVELAIELRQIKEEFISAGGEYRSRSATMVTEPSEYSQPNVPDQVSRANVSEITAEIIGQPKPTLATLGKRASRATIFSQSSSSNSAPFKTTVLSSSFDSTSPGPHRKTSRRISATDGIRILEKFKRPTLQDDLSPNEQTASSPPKLQRQPTIGRRTPLSNQTSDDHVPATEVLYENEELDRINDKDVGIGGSDLNPKPHRLQRQDAKSRKTFKIKHQKTKTIRNLMSRRGCADHSDAENTSNESSPNHVIKGHPSEEQGRQEEHNADVQEIESPKSKISFFKSVENISKPAEVQPSKPRYIQRSKSHDDPHADIHAPAGTVRGRIARQGARIVRSRSPSSSPVLGPKFPVSSPVQSKKQYASTPPPQHKPKLGGTQSFRQASFDEYQYQKTLLKQIGPDIHDIEKMSSASPKHVHCFRFESPKHDKSLKSENSESSSAPDSVESLIPKDPGQSPLHPGLKQKYSELPTSPSLGEAAVIKPEQTSVSSPIVQKSQSPERTTRRIWSPFSSPPPYRQAPFQMKFEHSSTSLFNTPNETSLVKPFGAVTSPTQVGVTNNTHLSSPFSSPKKTSPASAALIQPKPVCTSLVHPNAYGSTGNVRTTIVPTTSTVGNDPSQPSTHDLFTQLRSYPGPLRVSPFSSTYTVATGHYSHPTGAPSPGKGSRSQAFSPFVGAKLPPEGKTIQPLSQATSSDSRTPYTHSKPLSDTRQQATSETVRHHPSTSCPSRSFSPSPFSPDCSLSSTHSNSITSASDNIPSQTYVSRNSSDDSLNETECAALLKDQEKSKSHTSLCIYFDGNEVPDTLV